MMRTSQSYCAGRGGRRSISGAVEVTVRHYWSSVTCRGAPSSSSHGGCAFTPSPWYKMRTAMHSLDSYLPILVLLVLGFLFAALSLVASKMLAPQRPTAAKEAPYECGIVPTYEPPQRFPVRFYLVAMIFVIFDIEVIFLFPWAIVYNQLGSFGLIEIIVFAAAVFLSFVYLVAHGALDW